MRGELANAILNIMEGKPETVGQSLGIEAEGRGAKERLAVVTQMLGKGYLDRVEAAREAQREELLGRIEEYLGDDKNFEETIRGLSTSEMSELLTRAINGKGGIKRDSTYVPQECRDVIEEELRTTTPKTIEEVRAFADRVQERVGERLQVVQMGGYGTRVEQELQRMSYTFAGQLKPETAHEGAGILGEDRLRGIAETIRTEGTSKEAVASRAYEMLTPTERKELISRSAGIRLVEEIEERLNDGGETREGANDRTAEEILGRERVNEITRRVQMDAQAGLVDGREGIASRAYSMLTQEERKELISRSAGIHLVEDIEERLEGRETGEDLRGILSEDRAKAITATIQIEGISSKEGIASRVYELLTEEEREQLLFRSTELHLVEDIEERLEGREAGEDLRGILSEDRAREITSIIQVEMQAEGGKTKEEIASRVYELMTEEERKQVISSSTRLHLVEDIEERVEGREHVAEDILGKDRVSTIVTTISTEGITSKEEIERRVNELLTEEEKGRLTSDTVRLHLVEDIEEELRSKESEEETVSRVSKATGLSRKTTREVIEKIRKQRATGSQVSSIVFGSMSDRERTELFTKLALVDIPEDEEEGRETSRLLDAVEDLRTKYVGTTSRLGYSSIPEVVGRIRESARSKIEE
ncbi:MAG: hypothetical protein IKP28_02290 [Clostridia bacterium]|nr:hypothetical protein [Clostridia bacterium]